MKKQSSEPNYQAKYDELEKLVQKISSSQLDLDTLVLEVERGYGLIKDMRGFLDQTKTTIETLRNQFESEQKTETET